jgi:sugar lactone lactonase YvrE
MKNRVFTQNRIIFILVTVLLVFVIQSVGYTQGRGKIYWTETAWNWRSDIGKIRRANLNGTAAEDLVTGLYGPVDIALDLQNRKIYWTDRIAEKIQRANLDGTDVEVIVKKDTLTISPNCIALDVISNKIYWGNWRREIIQRANLDGSDVENLTIEERILPQDFIINQLISAQNIKLDLKAGKLYWTDVFGHKIARANLDGSDAEDLVTDMPGAYGLALDIQRYRMYWSNASTGKIQRSNLNGRNVKDIVTGLKYLHGIALDLRSRKIFWVDYDWETSTGKIQRANLDGANVTDILTGLNRPSGIALDLEGIYDVAPDTNKLTTTWANVKVQ